MFGMSLTVPCLLCSRIDQQVARIKATLKRGGFRRVPEKDVLYDAWFAVLMPPPPDAPSRVAAQHAKSLNLMH